MKSFFAKTLDPGETSYENDGLRRPIAGRERPQHAAIDGKN
jgi:hypothetical protein